LVVTALLECYLFLNGCKSRKSFPFVGKSRRGLQLNKSSSGKWLADVLNEPASGELQLAAAAVLLGFVILPSIPPKLQPAGSKTMAFVAGCVASWVSAAGGPDSLKFTARLLRMLRSCLSSHLLSMPDVPSEQADLTIPKFQPLDNSEATEYPGAWRWRCGCSRINSLALGWQACTLCNAIPSKTLTLVTDAAARLQALSGTQLAFEDAERYYVHISNLSLLLIQQGEGRLPLRPAGTEVLTMRNEGNQCYLIAAVELLRGLLAGWHGFGKLLPSCGLLGQLLLLLLQGRLYPKACSMAKTYLIALARGLEYLGKPGTPHVVVETLLVELAAVAPQEVRRELVRSVLYRRSGCILSVCSHCGVISSRMNTHGHEGRPHWAVLNLNELSAVLGAAFKDSALDVEVSLASAHLEPPPLMFCEKCQADATPDGRDKRVQAERQAYARAIASLISRRRSDRGHEADINAVINEADKHMRQRLTCNVKLVAIAMKHGSSREAAEGAIAAASQMNARQISVDVMGAPGRIAGFISGRRGVTINSLNSSTEADNEHLEALPVLPKICKDSFGAAFGHHHAGQGNHWTAMVERQGGLTEVNDSKAYPWEGNLYELKANTSFLAAVALSGNERHKWNAAAAVYNDKALMQLWHVQSMLQKNEIDDGEHLRRLYTDVKATLGVPDGFGVLDESPEDTRTLSFRASGEACL
jgi:hypothetical protein